MTSTGRGCFIGRLYHMPGWSDHHWSHNVGDHDQQVESDISFAGPLTGAEIETPQVAHELAIHLPA